MKPRLICATAASIAVMTASAPLTALGADDGPNIEIQSEPALDIETEAEVGQPMLSTLITSFESVPQPAAIELNADVDASRSTLRLTIPAGRLDLDHSDSRGEWFLVPRPIPAATFGIKQSDGRGGIFIPADPEKPAQVYWLTPFGRQNVPAKDPIEFHRLETSKRMASGTFLQQLIYSGGSNAKVRFSYR